MSASVFKKRPTWLKKRGEPGPKPEPPHSPHANDLDMFSRASQYHTVFSSERPRSGTDSPATPAANSDTGTPNNGEAEDGHERAKRRRISGDDGSPSPQRQTSSRRSYPPTSSPEPVKIDFPARQIPPPSTEAASLEVEPESPIKVVQSVESDMIASEPDDVLLGGDSSPTEHPEPAVLQNGTVPAQEDTSATDNLDHLHVDTSARDSSEPHDTVPEAKETDPDVVELDAASISPTRTTSTQATPATKLMNPITHDDSHISWVPPIPPTPQPQQPSPRVQIFVHSQIPNTLPLILHFTLDQQLRRVREAWCDKQGFDANFKRSVYLQWQKFKIFDLTTCKSLGIDVDASGDAVFKVAGRMETCEMVVLEAWTPELYKEHLAERSNASLLKRTLSPSLDPVEKPKKKKKNNKSGDQIKLVLKAQGYPEYKLRVRPDTPVTKMILAFRKEYSLWEAAQIHMVFDGDRLAEDALVQSTDIGDMDVIDVHVKHGVVEL